MGKRAAIVVLVLLAFGACRLPLERQLSLQHREAYFRGAELGLDLREQIGQLGFLAALSGFRSLVADMLWIEAHTAWERTEWGRMALLFNNVTTLQPRVILFWDMAAWHMAWNASVAAYDDKSQPREAVRKRAQREYFDLGRDFLARGIKNNPDRYDLYERMGTLLRDKYADSCGAAEYFDKAAGFSNSPAYEKRFAAYELSRCPGREREAYDRLRAIWALGGRERMPTLMSRLRAMEEALQIPPQQRIVNPADPDVQ